MHGASMHSLSPTARPSDGRWDSERVGELLPRMKWTEGVRAGVAQHCLIVDGDARHPIVDVCVANPGQITANHLIISLLWSG